MELQLFFTRLLRDESGVTSIEYALLGSLIAMAIAGSGAVLGRNLGGLYQMVAGEVCSAIGCEI